MKEKFFPKDIRFLNICGAIYDESILRSAMEYLDMHFPSKRVCIILASTGYPEIRFNNRYVKLHRLIGQYIFQDKEGIYQYHHIDCNKLNAATDNLQKMTVSEHQRLHGLGRKLSESHKQSISRSRRGVRPGNIRAILMLDKQNNIIAEYPSAFDAAQSLGIVRSAITNNLNHRSKYCNNHKFVYKDEYSI